MTIYDILKDTSYKTEQFSNDAIDRLNERLVEKEDKNGKKYRHFWLCGYNQVVYGVLPFLYTAKAE